MFTSNHNNGHLDQSEHGKQPDGESHDQSIDDDEDRPLTVREFRSILSEAFASFETSLLAKLRDEQSQSQSQSPSPYQSTNLSAFQSHVMKPINRSINQPVNAPFISTPPPNRPSTYMFGQMNQPIVPPINQPFSATKFNRPVSAVKPASATPNGRAKQSNSVKVKQQSNDHSESSFHEGDGEDLSSSNDQSNNQSINQSSPQQTSQSNNRSSVSYTRIMEAPLSESSPFCKWRWDGDDDWHDVPMSFVVPQSLRQSINLWLFGDIQAKIRPYYQLNAGDVPNHQGISQRTAMCKYRKCMEAIVKRGATIGLVTSAEDASNELSESTSADFFEQSLKSLLDLVRPGKSDKPRWNDVSAASLYDWIPKENKPRASGSGVKRKREEQVNLSMEQE